MRAFEHAKRLRDRGLPDGRFAITFEFIEQFISVRTLIEQIQLISRKGLDVISDDVVK